MSRIAVSSRTLGALLITFAVSQTTSAVAAPSETGLHKLHAASRVGGKLCFTDHFHEGDGTSFPTRHGAEGSAIRKWSVFTADEYGTAWGSYASAVGKKMSCAQGSDKYWICNVVARPCRIGK